MNILVSTGGHVVDVALCCAAAGTTVVEAVPRGPPATEGADHPNVVIVMTDDQGYGDLSAHGNPVLKTPHLDRMHEESVRFTDFHVSPFCTPTRAALMTGRYPARTGAFRTSSERTMLHTDERTIANVFAGAGYVTGNASARSLLRRAPGIDWSGLISGDDLASRAAASSKIRDHSALARRNRAKVSAANLKKTTRQAGDLQQGGRDVHRTDQAARAPVRNL